MKKLLLLLSIVFCSYISANSQTVTLTGSGTAQNAGGSVVGYSWRKVDGPASGIITNSNSAVTTVTGLTVGIYHFELTVTDNLGLIGRDTMQVTVLAANIIPKANAGIDQTITLPTIGLLLPNNNIDKNKYIVIYLWRKMSGLKDN